MALVFPVATTAFFDLLPIRSAAFDLSENLQINELGGGDVIAADLGPRLWGGEVSLGKMPPDEWRRIGPLLNLLRQGGRDFEIFDPLRSGPALDPFGTALGSAAVETHSIAANNRELRLKGLPAGYTLSAGDLISFTYGTPLRRALHEVVSVSVTAAANGITPLFEVVPNLRLGAAADDPVQLVQAGCRAMIVPNSFDAGGGRRGVREGVAFSWLQRIRP